MHSSGLRKEVRTVRGKHGTVKRSYWVKAQEATGSFLQKHKKKIVAGVATAAVVGAAAYGHRHAIRGAIGEAKIAHRGVSDGTHGFGAQLHALRTGAAHGWKKSTEKSGSWSHSAGKAIHKHLGTDQARRRTKNIVKGHAHTFLKSEMAGDLAEHFGRGAGAIVGLKATRGLRSMGHRVGGAAVGGIVGEHVAKGLLKLATHHTKTRKR
jgi:hypothetical protein